jgi:uncharacterized repeat protein (TIGR01451 family)
MFKKLQSPIRKATRLAGQNWLTICFITIFVSIIAFGAPAWAAPVTQGGTVPIPTPTSEGNFPATATPRPDDDDDEDNGNSGTNVEPETSEPVDPNNPNITFPTGPDGTPSAPAPDLTASVTVNGLNMREGPGTNFNVLGNIPANTQVDVLSRSEDGAWWYICCLPGTQTTGWVSAQLLAPNFDAAQANSLIPVFGTAPAAPAAATPEPQSAAPSAVQAERPLSTDFLIQPYFVWQGITATLTITVNNPNTVDAVNVLLSDELPESLTLVSAEADANGTVETVTTAANRPLLLFRWPTIPADTAATATIVMLIAPDLPDGAVIDNLVATRASNVPYSTNFVTIGMPPVVPPDFQ